MQKKYMKKTYKKRTYRRKPAKTLAIRALKAVNKIRNNFEKKFVEASYNSTVSNTLTPLLSCNLITQGDTATSRDGNQVYLKGIRLRFNMFCTGNTDDFSQIRIIVLKDLQTANDTYPAVGDVLSSVTNIVSPYNYPNNYKRFKILYDKIFPLNSTGIAYNSNSNSTIVYNPARFKQVWIWPKCKVLFNGTANSDVQKNAIWVYAMSSGTATVNLNMIAQTCFVDN